MDGDCLQCIEIAPIPQKIRNEKTATASGCSPTANAPILAILIKKFSLNKCPLNMFLIAFQTIS